MLQVLTERGVPKGTGSQGILHLAAPAAYSPMCPRCLLNDTTQGLGSCDTVVQVRTFNPLMNTTSSLYKALKKKKKKRKRAADEAEKD